MVVLLIREDDGEGSCSSIEKRRRADDGDVPDQGGDAATAWRNRADDVNGDELEEGVMLVVLQPKKANEG